MPRLFRNWASYSCHILYSFSKLFPFNNLRMHGRIHTRYMTLERRIMTILNADPPLSNTIMYDFRKRPGGPSGERLWFISDRDITSTLGQGDKTVMLAVPAQSPALQSKATVMNRGAPLNVLSRHALLCSLRGRGKCKSLKFMLYFS